MSLSQEGKDKAHLPDSFPSGFPYSSEFVATTQDQYIEMRARNPKKMRANENEILLSMFTFKLLI
jgi:hypothetical protein